MGTTMTTDTSKEATVYSYIPADPDGRVHAAGYLRSLADAIEHDQLNGFKVEWRVGKEQIEATLLLKCAPSHISMTFTVNDEPCESDS
jgi:hypothetical protein